MRRPHSSFLKLAWAVKTPCRCGAARVRGAARPDSEASSEANQCAQNLPESARPDSVAGGGAVAARVLPLLGGGDGVVEGVTSWKSDAPLLSS